MAAKLPITYIRTPILKTAFRFLIFGNQTLYDPFGRRLITAARWIGDRVKGHESIHDAQLQDFIDDHGSALGRLAFIRTYVYEWARAGFDYRAHRMEREAYNHEATAATYLKSRRRHAWKSLPL